MFPIHDDNPSGITPVITITLLVLCILVFLWQLTLGEATERVIYSLGVIPAVLLNFKSLAPEISLVYPWMTVFTSMFLHGGIMHLIGNMLYLWIFGDNVEAAMGHVRFVVFYLLCGTAAVFSQVLPDIHSVTPMIGASGAISGVLGAYLLLYPRARVLVLIPIGFILQTVQMPAGYVLGFWFVLQLVSSLLSSGQQGGVAWGAHIGGFIAGMLLIPVFRKRGVRLYLPMRLK